MPLLLTFTLNTSLARRKCLRHTVDTVLLKLCRHRLNSDATVPRCARRASVTHWWHYSPKVCPHRLHCTLSGFPVHGKCFMPTVLKLARITPTTHNPTNNPTNNPTTWPRPPLPVRGCDHHVAATTMLLRPPRGCNTDLSIQKQLLVVSVYWLLDQSSNVSQI